MSDIERDDGTSIKKENSGASGGDVHVDVPVDPKLAGYVSNLLRERDGLHPGRYPLLHRLVQNEFTGNNSKKGAVGVGEENGNIHLYKEAPITMYVKAMPPPTKPVNKLNFAGRIIGPKGAYLKALMKETMTKISVLGKGVMKDKDKEEQLRLGTDPKYYHLNENMHIAIQVTAPPSEAYARIAYALDCLKQQTLSDNRGLEELHWIANATRYLRGDATAPPALQNSQTPAAGGRKIRPTRPETIPPPRASSYPPRRTSYYDYPEDSYQYSHKPQRIPLSPSGHSPPSKSPYYSGPSSAVSRRRQPAAHSESSRAMNYVDQVRHVRPHSGRESRGSSYGTKPPLDYDYGHSAGGGGGGGGTLYDQEPSHHYYGYDGPSGGSYGSSADPYGSKPYTDRRGKSSLSSISQSQRYAPYIKKF